MVEADAESSCTEKTSLPSTVAAEPKAKMEEHSEIRPFPTINSTRVMAPRKTVRFSEFSAGLGDWVNKGGSRFIEDDHDFCRRVVIRTLHLKIVQLLMACVVLANIVLMVIEVDMRASDPEAGGASEVFYANMLVLIIYGVEVFARIYAFRRRFFAAFWGPMDLAIVIGDLSVVCLELFVEVDQLGIFVAAFRIVRLGRILKIVRFFKAFRELTMLIHGLTSALRAIAWSAMMIVLMLVVFGMIAVEFLHPVVVEMDDAGLWDDCSRCSRAFSSTWQSMLTFVQTIIAGDSWGVIAVPTIEYRPWSGAVLFTVLVVVQLGLLNLILAVIVERAHQARVEDTEMVLTGKAETFKSLRAGLLKLFQRIDQDGNGFLSEEEVLAGFRTDSSFADLFRSMGVTANDMKNVFQLMSTDGSGAISYKEFVEQLYRMKTEDGNTNVLFSLQAHRSLVKEQLDAVREDLGKSLAMQHAMMAKFEYHLKGSDADVDRRPARRITRSASLQRCSSVRSEEGSSSVSSVVLDRSGVLRGSSQADLDCRSTHAEVYGLPQPQSGSTPKSSRSLSPQLASPLPRFRKGRQPVLPDCPWRIAVVLRDVDDRIQMELSKLQKHLSDRVDVVSSSIKSSILEQAALQERNSPFSPALVNGEDCEKHSAGSRVNDVRGNGADKANAGAPELGKSPLVHRNMSI